MARVLVVEDEDVLSEMIAALVDDLGYESVVAASGQDALALLKASAEPPALIISDIMMPKMSGVELMRVVRDDTQFAHVPIILMSAGGRPANIQGANYFLHKPFNIDQLADLIDRLVREHFDQHGGAEQRTR